MLTGHNLRVNPKPNPTERLNDDLLSANFLYNSVGGSIDIFAYIYQLLPFESAFYLLSHDSPENASFYPLLSYFLNKDLLSLPQNHRVKLYKFLSMLGEVIADSNYLAGKIKASGFLDNIAQGMVRLMNIYFREGAYTLNERNNFVAYKKLMHSTFPNDWNVFDVAKRAGGRGSSKALTEILPVVKSINISHENLEAIIKDKIIGDAQALIGLVGITLPNRASAIFVENIAAVVSDIKSTRRRTLSDRANGIYHLPGLLASTYSFIVLVLLMASVMSGVDILDASAFNSDLFIALFVVTAFPSGLIVLAALLQRFCCPVLGQDCGFPEPLICLSALAPAVMIIAALWYVTELISVSTAEVQFDARVNWSSEVSELTSLMLNVAEMLNENSQQLTVEDKNFARENLSGSTLAALQHHTIWAARAEQPLVVENSSTLQNPLLENQHPLNNMV